MCSRIRPKAPSKTTTLGLPLSLQLLELLPPLPPLSPLRFQWELRPEPP